MKKFLSLVLALVMTMSLVTVSAGAKDFTDNDAITYEEAVAVMSEIGVIDGYTTGDFKPTATLTRGAAAKIICNLILGPTTASALAATTAPFSDVAADSTFAGYIAYLSKEGIIGGYADGTFKPGNSLTGYAFLKMLLGALGYDASIEGYNGANYAVTVAKQAIEAGLTAGLVNEFDGRTAVTREEACLYAFNTLQAIMVEYDNRIVVGEGATAVAISGIRKDLSWNKGTLNDGNIKKDGYVQFAEQYFPKLTKKTNVTDEFGRPAVLWIYNKTEIGTYVDYTNLVVSYTATVKGGTVYSDIGSAAAKFKNVTYYVDGKLVKDDVMSVVKKGNTDTFGKSGAGVLTEVYVNTDEEAVDVIMINTYIADVTADYNAKKEYVTVAVQNYEGKDFDGKIYLDDVAGIEDLEKDDVILVQIADGVVVNVIDPTVLEDSTISKFSTGDKYVVTDGTTYNYAKYIERYEDVLNKYDDSNLKSKTYDIFVDQYGYAIGIKLHSGTAEYLFLAGYDKAESNLTLKTAESYVIFVDGTAAKVEIDFNESNKNLGDDVLVSNGDANRNQWFEYSEDDGIYTLKAVADQIVVNYADKKTVNCESARLSGLDDNTEKKVYVWGNDYSNYILVETDDVDADNDDYRYSEVEVGISKVKGVYTGVQDVDIDLADDSAFIPKNSKTGDVVYALYGDDNYITAAIVLGDTNDDDSKAYAYALKGAKNESFSDGYYYWDFEAAVGGEVKTLTIKTKYDDVINVVKSAIVEETGAGCKGLLKLTYDKDGYVTKAELMDDDNATDKIYSAADRKAEKDLDPALFDAYQIYYADGKNTTTTKLTCTGRTLYARDTEVGLTLVSGAPVVVVQYVEKANKKTSLSIEEYTTIAAALNALANEGDKFVGTIAAALNSKGNAEWIVISSATTVPYEKKTDDDKKTENENITVVISDKVTYTVSAEATGVTALDIAEAIYTAMGEKGYTDVTVNMTSKVVTATKGSLNVSLNIVDGNATTSD